MIGAAVISCLVVVVAYVGGQALFAERLHALQAGKDASFFYRFTGPMLVALDMFKYHPWAGSGLTGEPYIADRGARRVHATRPRSSRPGAFPRSPTC